jgi:outer membrane protein
MRKILGRGILMLGVTFFISSWAFAADPLKIGVFELQRVMKESKVIEGYRQQIGQEVEVKKRLFTQKQDGARQTEDKLIKELQKLSPTERASLEEKLGTEVKELKRLKEDIDLDIQKMDRQLTQKAFQSIDEAIKKIAQRGKYTIIQEKNAGGVAYFNDSINLTAEIIRAIDKK